MQKLPLWKLCSSLIAAPGSDALLGGCQSQQKESVMFSEDSDADRIMSWVKGDTNVAGFRCVWLAGSYRSLKVA